ncbi:pirin family protein [Leeia oryzae]|uniref:pirin family protein n=1 Tax=Leeia oryzae TaxID=356662 RepID=UPI000363658D|nr:pirin family protein [Leeia oryzae]
MNTTVEQTLLSLPESGTSRGVERLVRGMPTSDGAGVRLLRVLTQDLQRRLDPFLMLDEFRSDNPNDYIAGFPDHPHRGFETVTYLIAGCMQHRDNHGGAGLLETGGVQWMVAGKGIIHSEMPQQKEGRMQGFQLWLNLPAKDKMTTPGYQDIPYESLTHFRTQTGVSGALIAGRIGVLVGPVEKPHTEPLLVDLTLPAGSRIHLPIPAGHNAFAYVFDGEAMIGDQPVAMQTMALLDNQAADGVTLANTKETPVRIYLVAGHPLNEPIAQYGPFVMNTRAELEQAFMDYQSGKF